MKSLKPFGRFLLSVFKDSLSKSVVVTLLVAGIVPIAVPIAQHFDPLEKTSHAELWSNIAGYWASLSYLSLYAIVTWLYLIYACFKKYEAQRIEFIEANRKLSEALKNAEQEKIEAIKERDAMKHALEDKTEETRRQAEKAGRERFDKCVMEIRKGTHPIGALLVAGADEFDTDEDLYRLCDDLKTFGHGHPFENSMINSYVKKEDWLKFLFQAKRRGFKLDDIQSVLEAVDAINRGNRILIPPTKDEETIARQQELYKFVAEASHKPPRPKE